MLFIEFAFVVKSLIKAAKAQRPKVVIVEEGPPPGSVIQGASNWDGLPEESSSEFNLETIGVPEALRPVPPAYGVYRGSIRVTDRDIGFAYTDKKTNHIGGFQKELQCSQEL